MQEEWCEYINGYVIKTNDGCLHGKCSNCKWKEQDNKKEEGWWKK